MKIIDFKPKQILLTLLLLLLTTYSLYQARFLIFGPQISINSHVDGQIVETPLITIKGHSKNISWISLNDRQIFTDENGVWSEELIVSKGLSIMTVKARDHFGHETSKSLKIVLK